MDEFIPRQQYVEAAAVIQRALRPGFQPAVAIVLGSGLGALADEVHEATVLSYGAIPHFPVSTIAGHQGRLVMGELQNKPVIIMQGRAHFYEGYSMQQVTLPIRVFRQLGVTTLILTNAAGGLNPSFRAGDLMLITDHINLIGMAGQNPLRGPNDPELGPRFPDMSSAYDRTLRRLAQQAAADADVVLRQGVYICLAGPTFETPADVRFLRLIGADAVGMSTVPEAIVARHGGMRVLGLSGISNLVIDQVDGEGQASHEEVLEAGKLLVPRMLAVIRGVLAKL